MNCEEEHVPLHWLIGSVVAVELVLVLALVFAVGAAHRRDLSLKSMVKDGRGRNNDISPSWAKIGSSIINFVH